MTYCKGPDVYHGDGVIDWAKVLDAGCSFGFCKLGEGFGTDPKFRENWKKMGEVGITRGVYFFLHPEKQVGMQANLLISAITAAGGLLDTDERPYIDIETNNGCSREQVIATTRYFATALEKGLGVKPGLYTSPGFAEEYLDDSFGDLPLWIAHYTSALHPRLPAGWDKWTYWQYAAAENGGHPVPGCPEPSVDMSYFNGSHDELVAAIAARRKIVVR